MEGLSGGIIVALVDFLMVFIVLGGLAGVLVVLRRLVQAWEQPPQEEIPPSEIPDESGAPHPETSQEQQTRACIAAISVAIQDFTALPEGAFRIDYIEPIAEMPSGVTSPQIAAITAAVQQFIGLPAGMFRIDYIEPVSPVSHQQSHVVAIAAAMHEYFSTPRTAFRIVKRHPLGIANTWKMAGRLELMELETD